MYVGRVKQCDFEFCSSWQFAKSHRLPFMLFNSQATKPFELVHSDLWGPSLIKSITGAKYFLLFIDDYSHFTWLYLLNSEDETFSIFLKFHKMVEVQFDAKIKSLQTE